MQTIKLTTNRHETLNIRYHAWEQTLQINGQRITFPTVWDSRMYQEEFFRGIPARDIIAEHGIRSANALLTDYYYHSRSKKYFDEFWEVWRDLYDDQDDVYTALSMLDEAATHCDEVLFHCLTKGWKQRTAYMEAALCLLYDINGHRNMLNHQRNMSEGLQTLLQEMRERDCHAS